MNHHRSVEARRSFFPSWLWSLREDTVVVVFFGLCALLGLMIGLIAAGFLPPRFAAYTAALPFAGVGLGVGVACIALKPKWVFYGSLLFCMWFPEQFQEAHLPLGFMKLYVQDVALAFNVLYVIIRLLYGKVQHRRLTLNYFVTLYLALGAFSAFNGLVLTGNTYDRVFGDLRRAFVYFLSYFIVLFLIDDERERRWFRNLLLFACGGLIAKGFFQALTGQFYYRRFGDAAHILSHYELTYLSFGVCYAVAQLVFESKHRLWPALYALAGIIVTIIGNYRASWLGLIGSLLFLFFFFPAKRRVQLTVIFAGLAIVAALTIYALWDVEVLEHSTLGEEIALKADVKNAPLDINVVWRFDSYRATLEYWRERPWLGCGLGTIVDFATITSRGTPMLALDHRVHNSFLWLFMTQGIIGFPIAMSLHVAFLIMAIRFIRGTNWPEGKVTVLACTGYAVSMLISAAFEIFLESGGPITVYSSVLGLAAITMHEGHKRASRLQFSSTKAVG
ncbi:MAG: O-antigen ligase family protein [Candidatus Sumerlaeaceae bacterium]|nr:O-antigen ligase family protein [Candidatus Sumerlaeaceae bacterium]